jgi:hypothetical protein
MHRAAPPGLVDMMDERSLDVSALTGRFPPESINRQVAGRAEDPPSRIGRRTGRRPAFQRDDKGLLDRLLGEVDIAAEADQGCHDPTELQPERLLDACRSGSGATRH